MRSIQLIGKSRAAYLDFKGRRRASTFFKNSGKMLYIRSGSQFRRTHSGSLVETARVLAAWMCAPNRAIRNQSTR